MLELYFVDHIGKTLQRFAKTDYLEGLLDLLQIVLDTSKNGLDDVVILDPLRPGKAASAARVAAYYGMRKRTFYERLENVTTYNPGVIK